MIPGNIIMTGLSLGPMVLLLGASPLSTGVTAEGQHASHHLLASCLTLYRYQMLLLNANELALLSEW